MNVRREESPAVLGGIWGGRAERSPGDINSFLCIRNSWDSCTSPWTVTGVSSAEPCPRSHGALSVTAHCLKECFSFPILLCPQLQSPAEPELFLCYRDGSQYCLCEPAVTDLGGEPGALHWGLGCGCGTKRNAPGGTCSRNK